MYEILFQCMNLRSYVSATAEHWFTIISSTYVTAMQGALDRFGWPFIEMLDNKVEIDLFKIQYTIRN